MITTKIGLCSLAAVFAIGTSGCGTTPLNEKALVPRDANLIFPSSGKTCCLPEIEGRKTGSDFYFYYITTPVLRTAVEGALTHSRLFTSVCTTDEKKADYTLYVSSLGQPADGWMTTFALYVRYRLKRNDTGETVFNELIRSECSSKDDVSGGEKYRLSVEGMTRENLREMLTKLSKVKL